MTRTIRIVLAVLAIAASGTASATAFNLGSMGPPALRLIGNDFSEVGAFSDEFAFSLSGAADSFGFTLAFDASLRRDIDILNVGLSSDGTLAGALWAPSTDTFSFSNLSAGAYSLFVTGNVTGRNGGLLGGGLVGYAGTFVTTASAKAVPEPGTIGLFGIGLLGMFYGLRRKRLN